MSERRETIFYDSSAAMDRIGSDKIELGQRRAVAAHDVSGRVIGRDSEVAVRWTPAHQGVEGNEMAGTWAKAAVMGSFYEDGQAYLREVSLSYTTRRTAEARSQATVRWISDHVREGQETLPPPEGQRRETGAPAGGGRLYYQVLDRTRLDQLLPVRQDPSGREQWVLVVRKR